MKFSIGLVLGVVLGIGGTLLFQQVTVKTARANGEPVANTAIPYRNGDVNGSDPVNVDIGDAIYILQWLFLQGPPPKPFLSLPATGQTKCYDAEENVIECSTSELRGQDGFYQAGCPTVGRFVDNGDGTVTDACTGLMWQKDTADVDGNGGIGGGDHVSWQGALDYCENLDFAGHTDWRLPNIHELESIVDFGRLAPAIDPVFGAISHFYWSSTPRAKLPGSVEGWGFWEVNFATGRSDDYNVGYYLVRAVRNAP